MTLDTISEASRVLMNTYRRYPVTFVEGSGCWLVDDRGRRYLDFLSGLAVVSVGHANPRVAAAAATQLRTLTHTSNLFHTTPMVELAGRVTELSGLDKVFFSNDGATANEAAIKLARRFGQQRNGPACHEIVSLADSFHGRTLATLAATGQPTKQATFQPLPPGFKQVAVGDIDALAEAVTPSTAGVLIETIQGEGGVNPLPVEYLREVRQLCEERDVVLIVDDVQAGMGRTGTWFSWQQLDFTPDIATVAKALANGLPIGACLATGEVASAFHPGDHATTFGGGPVVCAAALAVIAEISERELLANCRERSIQLRAGLAELDGVIDVRGRGLLVAAVLSEPRANEVMLAALEEGLVTNDVREDAVRFAPPLTVTSGEVDEALARFARALGA